MALGAVLLYFSGYSVWEGITHIGPSVWRYGGEKYDGRIEAEEFEAVIREHQYKRNSYAAAVMFFVFGGVTLLGGGLAQPLEGMAGEASNRGWVGERTSASGMTALGLPG